jgi:dTDP-4-dehydrorhamnose reductase
MKLWVIGAEGLLGKAMLKQCALKDISVVGTNREQADIARRESLVAAAHKINPTHIVNCAAYTNVDKAEGEREKCFEVNADGPAYAAEIAREMGARFVHISTDFVFNDTCLSPFVEDAEPKPVNIYGQSKWEGEKRALLAYPEACVVRTSWLFGKGGKNYFSALIDKFRTQEEVSAIADQWGCVTYAPDLALAIVDLLNASGIFHFAQAQPTTRLEVAQAVWEEMQKRGLPMACQRILSACKDAAAFVAPRPTRSVLSAQKYIRITGKQPREWRDAIGDFVTDGMAV